MELGLFGRPFGFLQFVLVKCGLFVSVYSRSCHHVAAWVAPGRAGQLLGWRLDGGLGLLWLLRWRLRLGEGLLGWLVIGGGRCGGVAGWIITRVANAWGWGAGRREERKIYLREEKRENVGQTWAAGSHAGNGLLYNRTRRTNTIPKWSLKSAKSEIRY